METFMLNLGFRTDEKVRELSLVGRLTFLQAAAAFDGNWGHAIYNPTVIVAAAWPIEQALADEGDQAAEELIAEAKREFRKAVEIGLFVTGEVEGQRVIAYRNWERYNASLRHRGAPRSDGPPMTPEIAESRNWASVSATSRRKTDDWLAKHGLQKAAQRGIARFSKDGSRATCSTKVGRAKDVLQHENSTCTTATATATAPPSECAGARTDTLPSTLTMPDGCERFVREATGLHPKVAWQDWRRACVPPPSLPELLELTGCESCEQWVLGLALDVRSGARWPDFKRKNLTDAMGARSGPSEQSRAKAARMLLDGARASPVANEPALVIDETGDDGWGNVHWQPQGA